MSPNLYTIVINVVHPEIKPLKKKRYTQRQATVAWAYYKIAPWNSQGHI